MNGSISSPMPGKVIKIGVKVGDQVFQGKTLAIVEAMKMENHINAPSDGVVKSVFIKEGDMVDGGMILMSLE
jgi:biotin carboxyl carrier protein